MEIAGYTVRYQSHRLEAIDDYYGATVRVAVEKDGEYRGTLAAEQRYHPNGKDKRGHAAAFHTPETAIRCA